MRKQPLEFREDTARTLPHSHKGNHSVHIGSWTLSVQNYKKINTNVCCFKSLSFWQLLMAATGEEEAYHVICDQHFSPEEKCLQFTLTHLRAGEHMAQCEDIPSLRLPLSLPVSDLPAPPFPHSESFIPTLRTFPAHPFLV